ncbi:MAG: SIMPL domain-containing protein [Pseudomonadales bacterium]|jgi:uncharacterized protein YggE|nr:SIMPL domain-containing protein [Pseudomonadales bacterium]
MKEALSLKKALGCMGLVFGCAVLGTAGVILTTMVLGSPFDNLSLRLVNTEQRGSITVDGEAVIETVPDQVEISLGITVQNNTVRAAQDEANGIITNLQAGLRELGVENNQIRTRNYSVFPNYDWTGRTPRIVSYTVDQNLVVTINDFDLLNEIIDLATGVGINQVSNINFSLSPEKRRELQEDARRIAIEEARSKAQSMASDANIRLGSIINISERTNNFGGVMPMPRMAMGVVAMEQAEMSFADTAIEAGSASYTYTISLTFEIE